MKNTDLSYIRKIQLKQLQMLKVLDACCQKYEIKYFLGDGSLLGAVRYNGIIPWDDDIDIWILREDYERLCVVFDKELPDIYSFVKAEDSPFCDNNTAKLLDTTTTFVFQQRRHIPTGHNIALDIRIFDNMPTSKFELYRIWALQFMANRCRAAANNRILNVIFNFGLSITNKMVSRKRYYKTMNRLIEKYRTIETPYVISWFTDKPWVYWITSGIQKKDNLRDSIKIQFEDSQFPIPVEYNECLINLYGENYIIPPPPDKQFHPGFNGAIVDLDHPFTDYMSIDSRTGKIHWTE
jgi:lipopolysaccharide cholinephosphotransferase